MITFKEAKTLKVHESDLQADKRSLAELDSILSRMSTEDAELARTILKNTTMYQVWTEATTELYDFGSWGYMDIILHE